MLDAVLIYAVVSTEQVQDHWRPDQFMLAQDQLQSNGWDGFAQLGGKCSSTGTEVVVRRALAVDMNSTCNGRCVVTLVLGLAMHDDKANQMRFDYYYYYRQCSVTAHDHYNSGPPPRQTRITARRPQQQYKEVCLRLGYAESPRCFLQAQGVLEQHARRGINFSAATCTQQMRQCQQPSVHRPGCCATPGSISGPGRSASSMARQHFSCQGVHGHDASTDEGCLPCCIFANATLKCL